MAISRNSGSAANTGGGNGGMQNQSVTGTAGPRIDTSVTTQNSNSSSSSNSSQRNVGSKSTTSNNTITTKNKNMSDSALAALDQLVANLSKGGTPQDQQRWAQIQSEIRANTLQQQKYSKESAQYDADTAAKAAQYEALQQMAPTISAGIDSAGTSGSAMAALLAQDAADQAARASAQLQLDAMISYGQIANQASGNSVELLKIDNPVTQQLLAALDIAKGAVTESTQTTKANETSRWNENITTSGSSKSSGSSTTTQIDTIGPQSTLTTNNSGGNNGGSTNSSPLKSSSFSTPSSYSKGNTSYWGSINPNKNIKTQGSNYSQF